MLTYENSEEAGGVWAISVYDLQGSASGNAVLQDENDSVSANSSNGSNDSSNDSNDNKDSTESSDTSSDTGKDADRGSVESGSRAFTVVNRCSQTIRIGSTGGR